MIAIAATKVRPIRRVTPYQYGSGYRARRLESGPKRKFPCGKKSSWNSRKSGSNAIAAATATAAVPAPAVAKPV